MTHHDLSWTSTRSYVRDGGLETDLIFHHGVDLPEFASFPLVDDDHGRELLRDYYNGYAGVARRAGAGLTMESPTWRANPDWGARVGYQINRHWSAALNLANLFDKTYYQTIGAPAWGNFYGEPRSVTVSLRGRF